ncbi:MAG: nitroreductase family protein [Promethearchaeota archaeon]
MNGLNSTQDIFKIIHNRRSIRKFTDKAISDEVLETLLKAGVRAPFAAQLYSIIYTRNPEIIKEKNIRCGVYPTTKLLMFFFVDARKIEKIINQRGYTYDYDDINLIWLAIQDATLVVENIILTAEALGLGSVLLGAVPNQWKQINELFNVPPRVFPIIGLCIGYPDPSALMDIRPRYPLKYIAFEDQYKDLTEEEVQECMEKMDKGYFEQGYYIKQKAKIPLKKELGDDKIDYDIYSWSEHISRKMVQGRWGEKPFITLLEDCGFKID